MEERTIVLLGKTGVGKSATGNTILGRDAFKSQKSLNSVTEQCEVQQREINGKIIRVVDTPGFFETKMSEEELARELGRSVYLSRHGVHAFILVLQYGRITEQEQEMITKMQKVFGEDVTKHMILLFTHGDGVENNEIESNSNHVVNNVLGKCERRYQIFNNTGQNSEKVTNLVGMIEEMVERSEGRIYTNKVYEAAKHNTWEQFWKLFKKTFRDAAAVLIEKAKAKAKVFRSFANTPSWCIQQSDEEHQHLC